jgi:hypothetical protein
MFETKTTRPGRTRSPTRWPGRSESEADLSSQANAKARSHSSRPEQHATHCDQAWERTSGAAPRGGLTEAASARRWRADGGSSGASHTARQMSLTSSPSAIAQTVRPPSSAITVTSEGVGVAVAELLTHRSQTRWRMRSTPVHERRRPGHDASGPSYAKEARKRIASLSPAPRPPPDASGSDPVVAGWTTVSDSISALILAPCRLTEAADLLHERFGVGAQIHGPPHHNVANVRISPVIERMRYLMSPRVRAPARHWTRRVPRRARS